MANVFTKFGCGFEESIYTVRDVLLKVAYNKKLITRSVIANRLGLGKILNLISKARYVRVDKDITQ